jgi:hypothetical protein
MKAATIQEIKQEISSRKPGEITELCLRLARFKKENKELLTYLLFEAADEEAFITSIQQEIDGNFETINLSQLYFAKKSLRKIVRLINKFSRYSGQKETELRLRLYFCRALLDSGIPIKRNALINNLYLTQVKKIRVALASLHEDLQYDYKRELEKLE